ARRRGHVTKPDLPDRAWMDDATLADVIIEPVATRQDALRVLKRIAEQGEGEGQTVWSHFERFYRIMTELKDAQDRLDPGWQPTHKVADDPKTRWPPDTSRGSIIASSYTEKWTNLYNLRYQMLLVYLTHSFQLSRDASHLKGLVMHKVFAEMYNL